MNTSETKKRSSLSILDFIPGAAAVQLCRALSANFRGTPLESALGAALSVLLGSTAVIVLCFLLRIQITKTIQNRNIALFLALTVSLGLSVLLIAATAYGPLASPNSSAVSHKAVVQDGSINAFTVVQDAGGTTDEDITTDEVGRWASTLLDQAGQAAKHTCTEHGGNASICAQIIGAETHQVIQSGGRKIAIIRIRAHLGDTTFGRSFRVMALKGHELVSVACVRAGENSPLTPTMSPCAEEIKKSLGFTFPQP